MKYYECDCCGNRIEDKDCHWYNSADVGLCNECVKKLSKEELAQLDKGNYSFFMTNNKGG